MHLSLPAALLALLVSHATSVEAALFRSKNVKQLTGRNFRKAVQGSEKLTLAAFVAPWCGYCKKLAPEYDRAADNLAGLVNLVAVDCDEDSNKPLCGEMQIQGFPTLKVFPGGAAPPQDYGGAREAKAIVEHVTGRMPMFVKKLTSASEVSALRNQKHEKPVAVLFTTSALVKPLFKALSTDLHKQITFYAAREAKVGKEGMAAFEVDKSPTLVVLGSDGQVSTYDGAHKYELLKQWLSSFAAAGKSKGGKDEL